ncbi:hypothetical protein RDI58_008276 [Solanum bulbocastanum]|uniref:Uncharacterized protein n=1 Tax=Solanum bulbocastanum TaxID=147425 RepID=A0AAN8TUF6_SOLBU
MQKLEITKMIHVF